MRGHRMVDRGGEHVGLEHHPRAAPRRRVIDSAMLVGREIADLHRRAMPSAAFERAPRHAVPQGAGKHVGIERQGDGGEAHRPNTPKTQRQNRASSKAALASSGGMPLSCSSNTVVTGLNTSLNKIKIGRISMRSRMARPAYRDRKTRREGKKEADRV